MIQNIISTLNDIARESDITIIQVHASASDPDVAIVEDKVIFMNKAFHTSFSYAFRLAHELAHLLNVDTSGQGAYAFSPYSRKVEERRAHEYAALILAGLFFADTPIEYRNYFDFMDILGLPASFEDIARDAVMNATKKATC